MAIWSLTQERVDKLNQQMLNKKGEYDALEKLSEKDLWRKDLDDFLEEWETQLQEDSEIQTKIRRMGRRDSKKIGAGTTKSKKVKDEEEDYAPKVSKKAAKPDPKSSKRVELPRVSAFDKLMSPKPKSRLQSNDGIDDDGLSDDDFATISVAAVKKPSRTPSEQPAETKPAARGKRAAAAKPKAWVEEESDSDDDDQLLDDIGDMVKGIGGAGGSSNDSVAANGRVSLFGMSRPGSSGATSVSKPKVKPAAKTFDMDSDDETNYEMLAKPSPRKSIAMNDDLDSFLSDEDDDLPIVPKKVAAPKAAPKAVPKAAPKAKAVPKKAAAPAAPAKSSALSPTAKAYAAKQNTAKAKSKPAPEEFSEDELDVDMTDGDDSPPKPVAKRPARAAATARAKKAVYVVSDDEDEDEDEPSALIDDDDETGSEDFESD
jgi:DNA topoisomerase-2